MVIRLATSLTSSNPRDSKFFTKKTFETHKIRINQTGLSKIIKVAPFSIINHQRSVNTEK